MPRPLPPNIHLREAKESDIPSIAAIGSLSFDTDTHTQFKALFEGKNSHEDGTREWLPTLLANPRCNNIVAVDAAKSVDGGDKIVGWICWAKRGYEPAQTATEQDVGAVSTDTTTDKEARDRPLRELEKEVLVRQHKTLDDLRTLTDAAMSHYQDILMPPGTKCRFIVGISVLPEYQRAGIGSALIRWGTEKCDEEKVFCWVSSSMGGWPMFHRANGFVEVGRQVLRLDDFAGEKTLDREWGDYIWRWGKREPTVLCA